MLRQQALRARRLVIIGFGPVAARLVDDLRPAVRDHRLQILIIGAEPSPAYNRIMIGDVAVGATDPELLIMSDPGELAADGIQVRLGEPVVAIDRERRYLTLAGGDQYAYDQLVFATGAAARAPRLAGLDQQPPGDDPALPDGVTVLRDLADADRLRRITGPGRDLVVLGGGVLGLELALTAAEHGTRVTLVHTGRVPMERNLDPTAAALVSRHLRRQQVRVIADARAESVRMRSGRFAALALADGREVPGDGLVLCCGAAPRTALAAAAGLATDNGILVDHDLRSVSDAAVFAIGDCARVRCTDPGCDSCRSSSGPSGLIGPGWSQAEQLARRLLAGADAPAPQRSGRIDDRPVMILKAPGLSVVSAGRIDLDPITLLAEETMQAGVAQWSDPEHGRYAKMITDRGVLIGMVCVGMPRTAAELTLLYERRAELPGDRSALLRHDGPDHAGAAPDGPEVTVCRCNGVTAGQIGAAVDEGHDDVAAIGRVTRAGTGCGTCKDRICELINNRPKVVMA